MQRVKERTENEERENGWKDGQTDGWMGERTDK